MGMDKTQEIFQAFEKLDKINASLTCLKQKQREVVNLATQPNLAQLLQQAPQSSHDSDPMDVLRMIKEREDALHALEHDNTLYQTTLEAAMNRQRELNHLLSQEQQKCSHVQSQLNTLLKLTSQSHADEEETAREYESITSALVQENEALRAMLGNSSQSNCDEV